MPVIGKIEQQKKQHNRFNIYFTINNHPEYAFSVSEDTLVRFGLAKGKELTNEDIQQLQCDDGVSKGLQRAFNFLSYRLRSIKEVENYLRDKELSEEIIQEVIVRLKALNYLDDLKFAQAFVRNEMNISRKGPIVIQGDLTAKGVTVAIQEIALLEYPEDVQLANALIHGEKVFAKQKTSLRMTEQKVMQTLMRKGFPRGIIMQVLQEIKIEDESDEWQNLCVEGEKLHRKYEHLTGFVYKQKMTMALYRKGYSSELINHFIQLKVQ